MFQGDKVVRVGKGQPGADLIHEVMYKGESCGKIAIDSKNHQGWKSDFVTKLRQDQVQAKAEYAILTTTAFPAGKKEMCIESDIIVIAPARAVYVVQLLRSAIIAMHVRGLSLKERATKMTRLYQLITSEPYMRKFTEAGKLTKDILDLDVIEKQEHDKTWKKRGVMAIKLNTLLREVETEVASVVEDTGQIDDAPPRQTGKAVTSVTPSINALQEAVVWNKR